MAYEINYPNQKKKKKKGNPFLSEENKEKK